VTSVGAGTEVTCGGGEHCGVDVDLRPVTR